MSAKTSEPKFHPGRLLATPGALSALQKGGGSITEILARHLAGDWGDVDDGDKKANDFDLEHGGRLLSAYHLPDGTKVWVITEADRSATTILLPEEY